MAATDAFLDARTRPLGGDHYAAGLEQEYDDTPIRGIFGVAFRQGILVAAALRLFIPRFIVLRKDVLRIEAAATLIVRFAAGIGPLPQEVLGCESERLGGAAAVGYGAQLLHVGLEKIRSEEHTSELQSLRHLV